MPAVGNGVLGVEVVPAVVALLVAVRLALQGRSFEEIPELEPVLLVDLFGLGFGDLVVGHGAAKQQRRCTVLTPSGAAGQLVPGTCNTTAAMSSLSEPPV